MPLPLLLPLLLAATFQDGAPLDGVARPQQTATAPIPLMIAEPVAMAIAAFDTDGDGVVTRAEFDAGVRHSFEAIANGQPTIGYVTFGDWSERWLGHRSALPSPFEVDQDGDNRISLGELQERFDLFFTRFDTDKDGRITRRELLTVRQAPPPVRDGRRQRPQQQR